MVIEGVDITGRHNTHNLHWKWPTLQSSWHLDTNVHFQMFPTKCGSSPDGKRENSTAHHFVLLFFSCAECTTSSPGRGIIRESQCTLKDHQIQTVVYVSSQYTPMWLKVCTCDHNSLPMKSQCVRPLHCTRHMTGVSSTFCCLLSVLVPLHKVLKNLMVLELLKSHPWSQAVRPDKTCL